MYTQDALEDAAKAESIDVPKLNSKVLIAQMTTMLAKAQAVTAATIFFTSLHNKNYKRHVHTDVAESKAKIFDTVAEIAESSRNHKLINGRYHASP